jgi:HK97 family phage major capsid protein
MSKRNDLPAAPAHVPAPMLRNRQNVAAQIAALLPFASNGLPRGDDGDAEAAEFFASLKAMSGDLKNLGHERAEIRNRLQAVEQVVASAGGGTFESFRTGGGSMPDVAAQATAMLAEDPIFQANADAAQRGLRASQFNSRVTVEGGIRAAITNIGVGQVGDTSVAGVRDRRGDLVLAPEQRLRLLDVLPTRRATADEVEFIQITATGDAGEQMKEGDLKAEVEMAGTLATAKIATVAAHTKASRQILSDQSALQAAIDRILRYKVLSKLENLILNGNGTTSKINGLLNQADTMVATIGTTPADIVGEALMRQANAGYAPNVVLLNPEDWFKIQITKNADDEYIFGSPTNPVPPALWNTQIVVTPAIAVDTGMVLDTSFTTLLDRWQTSVMVATENSDDFVRNLVTILAEVRAGLEVSDQNAILKFDLGLVT